MKCLCKSAIICLHVLLCAYVQIQAQNASNAYEGYWLGEIHANDELLINLTVSGNLPDLVVAIDAPDNPRNSNLQAKDLLFKKNRLSFYLPQVRGTFEGVLSKNNTIEAKWTQYGKTIPLVFKKNAAEASTGINGKWVCLRLKPKTPSLKHLYRLTKKSNGEYEGYFYRLEDAGQKTDLQQITISSDSLFMKNNRLSISCALSNTGKSLEGIVQIEKMNLMFKVNRVDPDTVTYFHPRHYTNGTPPEYVYAKPVEIKDGWKTAETTNEAFLSKMGELMKAVMKEELQRVQGIVVAKSGKLIFEEYFYQYNRDKLYNIGEMTGAITSSLTGIAIDKGFIRNVDDPVLSYFDNDYRLTAADSLKNRITIRHLMDMRTGTSVNDFQRGSTNRLYHSPNWAIYTLSQPVTKNPGDSFAYNSGNLIVLGNIIERTTKQIIPDFAEKNLFSPLGIRNYGWDYTPQGEAITSNFLHLSARDLTKIGQLYVNKGRWNGKQLISEKWITASNPSLGNRNSKRSILNYMWWNASAVINGKELEMYFCTSQDGSKLFIIPSLDIVFAVVGKLRIGDESRIVNAFILPAVSGL